MNWMLLLAAGCVLSGLLILLAGTRTRGTAGGGLGSFALAAYCLAQTLSNGMLKNVFTAAFWALIVLAVWQTIRHRDTP